MTATELPVLQWLQAHHAPALTVFMQAVSDLNGYLAGGVWAALFAAYLLWKRRRDWALATVVSVPGIMLVNSLVKALVKRPRPDLGEAVEKLGTDSFPSGHTAVSTVFYGLVAAYLISNLRRPAHRIAVAVGAFVLIGVALFASASRELPVS